MAFLLKLSRLIDAINLWVGKGASWLVLLTVLISAGNAVVRKAFDMSSNGFLEIQWYLFSAVFLLGAGYTLLRNEHIRIDLIQGRLSRRGQAWIDILGTLFFLLPMAVIVTYEVWPFFMQSFRSNEMSSDAGGLIRWPVWGLIPLGFSLLVLQALSELIKRIAFLTGHLPDEAEHHAAGEEHI